MKPKALEFPAPTQLAGLLCSVCLLLTAIAVHDGAQVSNDSAALAAKPQVRCPPHAAYAKEQPPCWRYVARL